MLLGVFISNKSFYLTLGGITVAFLVGVYGFNNGWFQSAEPPKVAKNDPLPSPLKPTMEQIEKEDLVEIGGVYRKRSDLEKQDGAKVTTDPEFGKKLTARIGTSPEIDPDTNVYTKSLAEALKAPKKFPERISLHFPPKAFDQKAFEEDPETYLTTIEPGRVYQNLRPGKDVQPLERTSSLFSKLIQGETVRLQVKGKPNLPVTFHCFDLGKFEESQLKTITVKADKDGVAQVNYVATKGTYGLVKIAAASPVMSERVHFLVNVSLPAESSP